MIGAVLDAVRPHARQADAAELSDETLSLTLRAGRPELARSVARQTHLRVVRDGRLGWACREDGDPAALRDAALAGTAAGPAATLFPPAPAPLPAVRTSSGRTAAMSPAELVELAERLRDRVEAAGRTVEVWAERSAGRVDVGNSEGVTAGYDVTLFGLGLAVTADTAFGPVRFQAHQARTDPPDEAVLAMIAAEVEQRLAPPALDLPPPAGPTRVLFMPDAVGAILVPLRQALHARSVWTGTGPLAGRVGDRIASALLTLIDDPLAPGRPGSRPIDDEGVVCRTLTLIQAGELRGAIADLLAASRLDVPATGHARRSGGAPVRAAWSNVRLAPGSAGAAELGAAVGDGILIRDLPRPAGNVGDGRVALATPWAYRMAGGEIAGRLERVTLRGNVFEWWRRVVAVGDSPRWLGAQCLPGVVVDGVDLV